MVRLGTGGCSLLIALALFGCDGKEEGSAPQVRPVRVATAVEREASDVASLSGTVEAKTEADLAFRIGGRLLERLVNVGDTVTAGEAVARLDPEDEENSFRAAQSELAAAEGRMIEAEANYERQRQLLDRGFTTRQRYDEAAQVQRTLRAQVDAATAQLAIARRRLDDTVLYADAPGAVTARGAEPGEVVQAGQMVVRVARKDGRDAVFDAPADLVAAASADTPVEVSLSIDPSVVAAGRVREVSPQADPVTGAFRVRVGLDGPPEQMRLGSTVTGRMRVESAGGVTVPATALGRAEGKPAVWVFDPATSTVRPRPVEVLLYRPSEVVLSDGLAAGEVVVTAGIQTLRPGEKVRLPGAAS
jgi:RND family efflux transporter MFP subunit